MSHSQSPLDSHRKQIETWLTQGYTYAEIINALAELGVPSSDRSIRRALDRWGIPRPGTQGVLPGMEINGDEATVTGKPTLLYSHPDDLLKERGLDPEDWEVKGFTVNEWDSPTGDILKQLKAHCVRRKPLDIVLPAQIDLNVPRPRIVKTNKGYRTVVLVGDQQAPHHDPHLHQLFCEWLRFNEPDEGVLIGDTADFPTISRHPAEPEWAPSVQECVNATGQLLYEYRMSSTNTSWQKLAGNHDERLRRAVINNVSEYYGLKPAELAELPELPPIHSPRHLFRLDELGIEYVEAKGSYDHAQVRLSPYLAARHGWLARKNSGSSAHATLDHLGHSIVVGHTHRQSLVYQTKFDIDGKPTTNAAAETGCMCSIKEGLGYAVAPDWQNGFATATIWPDGTFKLDLATYVDGVLLYRDQRYT